MAVETPLCAGFFVSADRASGVVLKVREKPLMKMTSGYTYECRKQSAAYVKVGLAVDAPKLTGDQSVVLVGIERRIVTSHTEGFLDGIVQ